MMSIALLSYGAGWHVRDLQRAARQLGHEATSIDWRIVQASVPYRSTLDGHQVVIVRTMPPGSLEHVVFRMDVLHVLQDRGVRVLNPPRALEVCVDKYLASARLEAAGLPTPPTAICQNADSAMAAFEELGGDVVVKPLFGSSEPRPCSTCSVMCHTPAGTCACSLRTERCWRRCGAMRRLAGAPTSPRGAAPRRSR
jgi:ribosomal protein S6--L-glutamate ligase